ncbi:hypothetical protein EJ03DRAFT_388048 [Teratosphaeria nubilosa]|uniref:GYF domain-containing protein n=1 Tax=Teratosphaeria nubilosa TaxID=161662 RepID=A0A6G1LHB0_9PEZI|nr:hypothetical protein EJ03DRAFT_388048 [Teratosphaeria nubilosa]
MAPSTFASAAAGSTQHTPSARDSASDWSRRTNGATQTFRRPSGAATLNPLSQPADGSNSSQPARYVPPHRNGIIPETMRYSREEMLAISKQVREQDGGTANGLSGLFAGGWRPDMANGSSSAGWNRTEHNRDGQPGPEVCWDKEGIVEPLGLVPMDDEEKELFSTSVNTPLKPTAAGKDGPQSNGIPGRKISVSGGTSTPAGVGLPSPSVTRGFGRRREPSESYPFPNTNQALSIAGPPELSRAASPPPSLQRRRTDLKESSKADNGSEDKSSTPFGTLKRTTTGPLSAGLAGPSSPWSNGPQNAGFSPMGSFGNFGLPGAQSTPSEKRTTLGSGRPESRFKSLLSKDSSEEIGSPSVQRKTSMSSLSRVNENDSWRAQEPGTAPVPENEEDLPSGSAALAAGSDLSPPQHRSEVRGIGTPSRSGTQDFGFGAFGMTTDNAHSGFGSNQGFLQGRVDAFHQQTPAGHRNEPMSPTDTNPYRSPEQHGVDNLVNDDAEDEGHDMHKTHLPGLGGFGSHDHHQQLSGLGGLGANIGRMAGVQGPASDRSQTSSVGPNRGFPGLGGLGHLGGSGSGGWPASQPGAFGTSNRPTTGLNAFGSGIFGGAMSELQSPSLAGLGGTGLMSLQSGGGFGGSKMASMFPPAMQEQMRQGDERDQSHERGPQQSFANLHGITGSLGAQHEHQQQQYGASGQAPPQSEQGAQQEEQSGHAAAQAPVSAASNQPPAPQQRTMVMPDRMRWIYRDPQGQTQGPWTGLEMHDWYKAGFFSPELLVKKYEDPEYEPLAQLIRRIGNSREPFLVPQIGIPHGAPSTTTGPNAWAGGAPPAPGPAPTAAGAQPPFASSFPSFGTTLTADQQNALERRKQEEQYLMARQKEHLAQVQIAQRMSLSGAPGAAHQPGLLPGAVGGQLHHHSSATSLHSQPSFGSMTSPSTFQPSPIQAPSAGAIGQQPGFFDNSFRAPGAAGLGAIGAGIDSLAHIREEEIPGIMDRLNLGNSRAPGAGHFGAPGQPFNHHQQQSQGQDQHSQQVQQMLHDRARLQQEQAEHDAQRQQSTASSEQPGPNERLQQFQQLQGQQPGLDARFQPSMNKTQTVEQQPPVQQPIASAAAAQAKATQEPLSLTEQVEAAVSAQQSPQPQQPGLPQPFPPAPSQSPLPAPAAQRTGRQSVADQLQTESRDLSQTPFVDLPSAAAPAPWAKEPAEAPKGPSLKEIQEMEAKKAAELEAQQAALRKAAFEKELEAQAATAAAAASEHPGLPSSASWGASPATPTNAASPWAKTAQKPTAPATKTMAQIQKEEEARKRRLVAAAHAANAQANATASVAAPIGGKSYANLAGKVASPPTVNTGSGAWTTVGAGGKLKTPATPTAPPGIGSRTANSGVVPGAGPQPAARKAPSRTTTLNSAGTINAQEEFRKWAVAELRGDLAKGVSADDFVATLSVLGLDVETLTEAVHSASSTIDSRHFAEEFIRRKKLADKGLVDAAAPTKSASPANAGANANGGGWSEVAKKGPGKVETMPATESNGAFRVVNKKGKAGRK